MICIYGASDDLVEIEGHNAKDEIGCYDHDVCIVLGDNTGGLAVRMSYEAIIPEAVGLGEIGFGCWSAAVVQIGEDIPVPWDVRVKVTGRGYSVGVFIDAPRNVPMRVAKVKR